MADNPTPTSKPKAPHAAQDQALANRINARHSSLTAAQANAELMALLETRGYDAVAFTEGLTQCGAVQTAFNARLTAIIAKKAAGGVLKAAVKAARAGYTDFRKIAGSVFKDNATAKAAVCVPERQLQDLQKFLTTVEAAYDSALTHSTYLTALARRGYTEAAIQAELVKLKAAAQADADYTAAEQAATRATELRKVAAKTFDKWWAEFYTVAEVTLKDRPDLLGLLRS